MDISSLPKYCVYLTVYYGSKLPPFYIGSSSILKVANGYHGTVSSICYKKIYKLEIKEHPELFKTFVIKTFYSRKMATHKEKILQKALNVVKSPMYFNQSVASPYGYAGMNVKGKNNPNYGNKMPVASRKNISKFRRGKTVAKNVTTDKLELVSTNDIRWLTNNLVGVHKGKNLYRGQNDNKIVVKDKDGTTFQVDTNDNRLITGELSHHTKGTKTVYHKITGEKLRISLCEYDPEIHINCGVGTLHVKDHQGHHYIVSRDDPRYLSGELIMFSKGTVPVKDKAGNKFRVDKNDPRYLSGELVHQTKGTANAYSVDGVSLGKIDITDPRWKTGELCTTGLKLR